MNWVGYLGWCVGGVSAIVLVYAIARLVAAAYFMSRYDYEERQRDRSKQQPR